ncbi:unnamed protein product [Ascophyllum nodosum]
MASSTLAVGAEIFDIGTRKRAATGPVERGQAGHHMPEAFGLPNVTNVRVFLVEMNNSRKKPLRFHPSVSLHFSAVGCVLVVWLVARNQRVVLQLVLIEVSNIVLNLIFRSEPLRAQHFTIVRSIPYSKQDVWSAPQSENMFKSFFLPSSPTGSY